METKKEKSKDSIIKTFFKVIGCIFLVLFAMTAIILGICFLSSKLEKYKDNMLMPAIFFVLFYIVLFCDFCMLFSLVENIIKYIKKTKTEINYEDKKVTSGFIKVVIELYGISYMYALLIIFSNYSIIFKFLRNKMVHLKYIVLINAILLLIAIIYCCFNNRFTYNKIEKCNLNKEEIEYLKREDINNKKDVALMKFLTLLCCFLCNGINYNKDFFIVCGLCIAIITAFEVIVMKHLDIDETDLKKNKKKSPYLVSIFSIIIINIIFLVPNILYINSNFGVRQVDSFSAATCYKEYSVHHTRGGGTNYCLNVVNPKNGKKYKLSVSKHVNYLGDIKVYKGLFQIEWAEMK